MNDLDKPARRQLIVTVGLPRSGKSTWVDRFIDTDKEMNYQVICADDIRLGMGFQFDSKFEPVVWTVHHFALRAALERGYSVIVDSCNTTVPGIRKYAQIAKEYDYQLVILRINTPLDTCLARNKGDGAVPDNVIRRMDKQLSVTISSSFWESIKDNILICTEKENRNG